MPVVTLGEPLEPRKQQNSEDFFVGRDAEIAILRDAAEQLINGSGGLIEVIGEPGIGKTRLVDEAVAQASDVTVLRCDCERTGCDTVHTGAAPAASRTRHQQRYGPERHRQVSPGLRDGCGAD